MQDRGYLLWMILPILPLLAGFAVLQVISNGELTLLSGQVGEGSFHGTGLDLRFFTALIPYLAIGLFHVAGCIAVMVVALLKIVALPKVARERGLLVLAVSILVLVAVNVLAREPLLIGALNVSYRTTCAILVEANAAAHILPSACDGAGLSTLAWLAVVPYVMGLMAAAAASALASTALHAGDEAAFMAAAERVERAFHATVFVLATSTLLMVLFYRLPLPLIADKDLLALVTAFGHGMGMFWGVMFTLTLMAIFGPAILLLPQRLPRTEEGSALRDRLFAKGARKRLTEILLILAPLMIGSAGTLLEQLANAI